MLQASHVCRNCWMHRDSFRRAFLPFAKNMTKRPFEKEMPPSSREATPLLGDRAKPSKKPSTNQMDTAPPGLGCSLTISRWVKNPSLTDVAFSRLPMKICAPTTKALKRRHFSARGEASRNPGLRFIRDLFRRAFLHSPISKYH